MKARNSIDSVTVNCMKTVFYKIVTEIKLNQYQRRNGDEKSTTATKLTTITYKTQQNNTQIYYNNNNTLIFKLHKEATFYTHQSTPNMHTPPPKCHDGVTVRMIR